VFLATLIIRSLLVSDDQSKRRLATRVMTRNRTAVDLFFAFGVEFVVVLLVTLAIGLAISNYLWARREDLRRTDLRIKKRTSRRLVA
jgi:hypothetical protein